MAQLDNNFAVRDQVHLNEAKQPTFDVNMADPQNALKASSTTDATSAGANSLFTEVGFMNVPDIFSQLSAKPASIALNPVDNIPATTTNSNEGTSISTPTANTGSQIPDFFGQPYTDSTINSFFNSDPTLAQALQNTKSQFNFDQPQMSASGFAQFEQSVVNNYNSYTPDPNISETANNAAILNKSLAGLTPSDAAAASSSISQALDGTYSDSTISSFLSSNGQIANALTSAEPNMSAQDFSQFEKNVVANYASAVTGTVPGTTADVLNNSLAGLSSGDSAAAQSAIAASLLKPYADQTINNFEGGPTFAQTLADAEPNMTLQGFTQLENSISTAENNVYSSGGVLNDSTVLSQATQGLSATDTTAATNAYATALNYTGAVGDNPNSPLVLSTAPYSDFTTDMIGAFDPQLAKIVSAAQPNMTAEGFQQFENDVQLLYNSSGFFNANNDSIVRTAEQNLSASNSAAAENAIVAAS